MVVIDNRIEHQIFTAMVGRNLDCIIHDEFVYSNSVYGIVGLIIDGCPYKITNLIRPQDYFGEIEDVADFQIEEATNSDKFTFINESDGVTTSINQNITAIDVVDEHQQLYENGEQTYDVWITRGLVIKLNDGLQLSFEKEIWFSEDINIEKGYNLITKFTSIDRVTEGFTTPYRMDCERTITTV